MPNVQIDSIPLRKRHIGKYSAKCLPLLLSAWLLILPGLNVTALAVTTQNTSAQAANQLQVQPDATLKGGVSQSQQTGPTVNPNDIKVIAPGQDLDLIISTGLESGLSAEGDEFFGKLSRPVIVDGKVILPRDTVVHGRVKNLAQAKRAGRNAHVTTEFDYLITPDGREIPIAGNFSNKDSALKAAAKVVGRSAGFSVVGGVLGAVTVLRYGGLAAVAASNGYALAAGAGVGGVVGLGAALVTKGKSLWIPPGTEMRVKLQQSLKLPSMNVPDASADNLALDGLNVKINHIAVGKDPFGEEAEITLTLDMTNATDNTFSMFDIALQDENGTLFFPSAFGDTGLWFEKLSPRTRMTGNISFSVDNPKLRHHLVFYKQYTREPLTRIALADNLEKATGRKKAH
jgi:phosphohistidine swiveling domain-containing protein